MVFQRSEIQKITIPHRGRSALIGTAIGGGAGAIIGFGVGTGNDGFLGKNAFRGALSAVCGVLGGVAGATTGGLTDFAHSTVYKAP